MQAGSNFENKATDKDYSDCAGFLLRSGAKVIDGILLVAIITGLAFISRFISQTLLQNGMAMEKVYKIAATIAIIAISLPVFYNAIMLSNGGATIGKKVFGIKVVTRDRQPLGFWIAFVRCLLEVICLFAAFGLGTIIFFIITWSLTPGDYASEQHGITKIQLLFSPIFLITLTPYLIAQFTPGKRALHDFLFVRTLVVKEQ